MTDPDPDEIAFFFVAGAATLLWSIRFYTRVGSVPRLRPRGRRRALLAVVPPTCVAGVFGVLCTWADPQVRDPFYLKLFLLGEGLWLGATQGLLRLLGVGLAEDVLERDNPAALVVFVGAMLATSLVYAGGNIGVGPTIWTTLVPAAVATAWLAVLGGVLIKLGGAADAIIIDRDAASGLRTAAALVACGLVLGRAAAGRFVRWDAALEDLTTAVAPTLMTVIVAAVLQRTLGPSVRRPRPAGWVCGALPALGLLVFAVAFVAWRPFPLDPSQW